MQVEETEGEGVDDDGDGVQDPWLVHHPLESHLRQTVLVIVECRHLNFKGALNVKGTK